MAQIHTRGKYCIHYFLMLLTTIIDYKRLKENKIVKEKFVTMFELMSLYLLPAEQAYFREQRRARVVCNPPLAHNSRFALASFSPWFARNMQNIMPVLQATLPGKVSWYPTFDWLDCSCD